VAGHFHIGATGKADLALDAGATHFALFEAKLFSPLSPGVSNARGYDQAARSVACVAEILARARCSPESMAHLGFYVLAPHSRIQAGVFTRQANHASISEKVARRAAAYDGALDGWYETWFRPTLAQMDIRCVSWEEVIEDVAAENAATGQALAAFYARCLAYGGSGGV
jgi:hypothetical protein